MVPDAARYASEPKIISNMEPRANQMPPRLTPHQQKTLTRHHDGEGSAATQAAVHLDAAAEGSMKMGNNLSRRRWARVRHRRDNSCVRRASQPDHNPKLRRTFNH